MRSSHSLCRISGALFAQRKHFCYTKGGSVEQCRRLLCALVVLAVLGACVGLFAAEPEELVEARKQFAALAKPGEVDRKSYIIRLAKLRAAFADEDQTESWSAVDAEILRHPAPNDTRAYTKLMVGKWSSPRHEYLCRADGIWSMLPEEEGTTRGRWHIKGNQFFSKADIEAEKPKPYTTLLLTKDNLIVTENVWDSLTS